MPNPIETRPPSPIGQWRSPPVRRSEAAVATSTRPAMIERAAISISTAPTMLIGRANASAPIVMLISPSRT